VSAQRRRVANVIFAISKMAAKSLIEQKKILLRHLPYVESKLERLRGTQYESKWQDFKDHIVLENKVLSSKRIKELDAFFINLKSRIVRVVVVMPMLYFKYYKTFIPSHLPRQELLRKMRATYERKFW
jgi:hypothetical protein